MKLASNIPQNRRKLAVFFNAVAILAIVLYAYIVLDHYSAHLDGHLHYKPNQTTPAREDVLGLGFWPMWLLVLFAWLMFEVPAFLLSANRGRQLVSLGIPFVIISVVDFYLAWVLALQVPT